MAAADATEAPDKSGMGVSGMTQQNVQTEHLLHVGLTTGAGLAIK